MLDKMNDNRLRRVPELPITPAFLIRLEFGSTIRISPDEIWKKFSVKNFTLVKSISKIFSLPLISLNNLTLSRLPFIVKSPAIPSASKIFKLFSTKLYLPGWLTSPRTVKWELNFWCLWMD